MLQECLRAWAEEGRPADLDELLAAAAQEPALERVVDIDDPAFLPPGDMPGRVVAAVRRTGQPEPHSGAALTRCILDSLALAYRRAVREAAELSGHEPEVVHVVGGGSRNELLCRLTAEATGLPVVAGPAEATAMGNLLVQAQASGAVPPGRAALRAVVAASVPTRRYEPQGTTARWHAAKQRLRA